MSFSWHAVPYFVSAILIAVTGVLIYSWERRGRASRYFLGFSALFTVWTLLRGSLHLMPDERLAGVLAQYLYCAVALGLPPLFQFIFMVLHTKRERRPLIRTNWVLGTFLAVLAVGTPWVVSGVQAVPWGLEPRQGPLGAVMMAWVAAMMGLVTLDAARAWRRSVAGSVDRRRLRLFCASLPVLFAAAGDLLVGAGVQVYPLGFACVLTFTLMAGYITWRHGLAEVTAQFAAHEIAELVHGALVVLDSDGVIQFINEQTAQVLGVRQDRAVGTTLRSILGDVAGPASLAALGESAPGAETEIVHARPGGAGPRNLTLSASVLRDRRGRTIAFVCVVRDVTEQRRQPRQSGGIGRLDAELRRAASRGEFAVHYQPILELGRRRIAGFEALVRWRHPQRGLLPPGEFLSAAERTGLIAGIDRFVLAQACADLARLRAAVADERLFVSVNQAKAVLGDHRVVGEVRAALERHDLPPDALRIELLETTVLIDAARDNLQRLRQLGVGVCIDDFGTGYSSLHRLHDAPVTALKIDRSFVRAMVAGENGRKIIASIVALANALHLAVVAEGVTAPEQARLLREIGCDYAQGFLFSPPVPFDAVLLLLQRDLDGAAPAGELAPA